jgi:ABC-2 type transport system permease protein
MRSLGRAIVRISAFIFKEMASVLRQPRLILTLVLGPFLILFLFGIGYRNQARALRTLFVVPGGSPLVQQIQEYAGSLGPQLVYLGTTPDEAGARQRLASGLLDVVVLVPGNAYETIRNNQQAEFVLLHNEIDPLQVDYVSYFGQVYVDQVNRRVLQSITQQGQGDASAVRDDLQQVRQSVDELTAALQRGDQAGATRGRQQVDQRMSALDMSLSASLGILGGVERTFGGAPGGLQSQWQVTQGAATELSSATQVDQVQRTSQLQRDLADLDSKLSQFRQIDPRIVVQPFQSRTESVALLKPTLPDYFAPSVIVLLLQHLAITFGALSMVQEQRLGTMELFRVSPISALEILLGKYVSFMLFGAVIGGAITAIILYVLHVPLLGPPELYAGALLALLFTSLGLGLVISLLSSSDSQAVQYAMLVLLTSVFFSGFIMSLRTLWEPVRVVSWLTPATYGIALLQDIMLRGQLVQPYLLAGLAAMGGVYFLIAWRLLHRRMAVDA